MMPLIRYEDARRGSEMRVTGVAAGGEGDEAGAAIVWLNYPLTCC